MLVVLRGLHVSNFKSLKDVSIEFKPLTVIIGPNSSGKSSILQSILLLKKLHLNQGNVPMHGLFDIEGYINMGLWDHLVFDESSPMKFSLLIGGDDISFQYNVSINRDGRLISDGVLQLRDVVVKLPGITVNLPYSQRTSQSTSVNVRGGALTLGWDGFRVSISSIVGSVPESLREGLLLTVNEWSKRVFFVSSPIAMYRRPSVSITPQQSREAIVNSVRGSLVPQEELLQALLASDGNLEDYVESLLEELFKIRVKTKVVPPYTVEVRSRVRRGRTALIVNEGGGVNRMTALFTILGLADRGSTILLEEPETNLHPAIQYKLAGILSRVVREERKQLIITTHSEHLLLGVLNSIAKGGLSPNDITVYYMYKDEGGESRVEKLEVDESGRVKGGLPGFFEAEVEELLEMLAPKSVAVG
ncbi:MAG: AAA family ATPase [Desulfurococcaceae archaeon]|nr:AAA family ATPase [Desulfurococcaceae archaeon]